ncbi:MAG TPA: T9SS type A sorting domain-containing protein [Chitinophagales bacterium]|nr:T9SS type A sorting domain-containing protein [Chitinophagales bacterium]
MKNQTTKKLCAFILLLSGLFSTSFLNAQNCSGNKVWACRYDSCGIQECKCISANQVASWTATVPKCSWKWHCPHCFFRINQNESGMGVNTSLQVYPNPVSSSAILSFSLEQSENVSLMIFDIAGRYVATVANEFFEDGNNELTWDASDINQGIYFLKLNAGSYSAVKRISIIK